jgi:acetyltransferase-like isoleucine patch superfamily enzyme
LKAFGFRAVGKNVKIHSKASVYCLENIELHDNIRIDDFTVIIATGPLVIGSYVSIPNFCFIGSKHGIYFGDFATLAPGVQIFSSSDDYQGDKLTNVTVPPQFTGGSQGPVRIGRHVILGAQTVVLPNLTVGDGCAVGACSLVKTSLDPWGIYAGIPVRRLKARRKDLLKLETKLTHAKTTKKEID